MKQLTWHWTGNVTPLVLAIVLGAVFLAPRFVMAAQLLMLEQAGCAFCEKFDREIAPAYPKTAEGKLAPLRRIDINEEWPEDLAGIKPTSLTPTFILVENNREAGRLYGYNGDEYFWFLLSELFENLQTDSPTTAE